MTWKGFGSFISDTVTGEVIYLDMVEILKERVPATSSNYYP